MLCGPARTAQAQGSGRGSPEHETACYGGAYPFPDLKFRRGADPVFSAAPRELQRHLLVQASRTIVAHADNMLLLETVQIQSDASSAHRGTYLCSPVLTTQLDFGEWFANLGLRSLVVQTPAGLQLQPHGMSPTIRMDLLIDPEAAVRHYFHHRHNAMSELLAQHHATSACSAEGEAVEAHSLLATGGPPIRQQVRQGLPEDADPKPQGTVTLSQPTSVECVSSGVVHEYASVNPAVRAYGIARGTIFRMIRDGILRRGLLVRQVTCADRSARTLTVQIERVPSGEVFEYASERAAANAHGIPPGSFYKMVRTGRQRHGLLARTTGSGHRLDSGHESSMLMMMMMHGGGCF